MSRIKERPGFLSRCLPSFPFHAPPSDNAGVQSNRVVVRPQAWQRSSRSCGSWPAATRRLDPHPKDRVVHYVHYVHKAQGGSELPVRVVGSRHLTSSSRSQGARSCSHGVLRCRTCGLRSSSLSSPGRRARRQPSDRRSRLTPAPISDLLSFALLSTLHAIIVAPSRQDCNPGNHRGITRQESPDEISKSASHARSGSVRRRCSGNVNTAVSFTRPGDSQVVSATRVVGRSAPILSHKSHISSRQL